jgi:hypothetical protein
VLSIGAVCFGPGYLIEIAVRCVACLGRGERHRFDVAEINAFLRCHRSCARCIASQLSGERPMHFERRSAIPALTLLLPVSTRLSVEGDTPSFDANSRPLMPLGSRYIEPMNSPGCGGLCIAISDSAGSRVRTRSISRLWRAYVERCVPA